MTATAERLVLRRPDDWHVHLRDGAGLAGLVAHTARQFARAIVMPNLAPPVTTVAQAEAYRARILAALPPGLAFEPLMTAYLTDETDPRELEEGKRRGVLAAAKLYPANATTNSARGVTDVAKLGRVFEAMQRVGLPLCVHGEVVGPEVDPFDREALFVERVLAGIVGDFPGLKVVLEHVTTREGVAFVEGAREGVAGTITPHHLELDRRALFDGGLRPHAYCLPLVKRAEHRLALRAAATSGSPRWFLGTDSAPHARAAKESACGCAGIFNAPVALESYARVFDEEGALGRLEGFASEHGPRFYGLPLNEARVALERAPLAVPGTIACGDLELVPYHAGETLGWRFVGPAG